MTDPRSPLADPERDPHVPAAPAFSGMRALAWAIFLVAAMGLAFHVVFYFAAPTEWLVAYARGLGIKIGAGIAFANLLVSHLHYWRTRMRLDITSRVVTYLWILSIILYMHLVLGGKPIWE